MNRELPKLNEVLAHWQLVGNWLAIRLSEFQDATFHHQPDFYFRFFFRTTNHSGKLIMQYPLTLSFKIMALAPQIYIRDVNDEVVCYVKQKMFKLKEAVTVFRDESQQQVLCEIKADRIIDWSASYHFYDASGESFGSVRRKGMRSIWKAHYEVHDENEAHSSTIQEENPMAKVLDGFCSEIPVLNMFTGYMFHPRYVLSSATDGAPKMKLTKQPAMFEGKYLLERMYDYDDVAELRGLMAFMMMALLERQRG